MAEKFKKYIEGDSWEDHLESAEEWLDAFCLAVIALAAVVFGPAIVRVVVEAVAR